MNFKMLINRFARQVSVMDLRIDAVEERRREIARKARRFESKNGTHGKLSVFNVSED